MRFNRLIALMAGILFPLLAYSQESSQGFTLYLKDNSTITFMFSDSPNIEIGFDEVMFSCGDFQAMYKMNEIDRLDFKQVAGIKSEISTEDIVIEVADNALKISGIDKNSNIAVYNLAGVRMSCNIESSRDIIVVDYSNLQAGIYIVSINQSKSIKIVKP